MICSGLVCCVVIKPYQGLYVVILFQLLRSCNNVGLFWFSFKGSVSLNK